LNNNTLHLAFTAISDYKKSPMVLQKSRINSMLLHCAYTTTLDFKRQNESNLHWKRHLNSTIQLPAQSRDNNVPVDHNFNCFSVNHESLSYTCVSKESVTPVQCMQYPVFL